MWCRFPTAKNNSVSRQEIARVVSKPSKRNHRRDETEPKHPAGWSGWGNHLGSSAKLCTSLEHAHRFCGSSQLPAKEFHRGSLIFCSPGYRSERLRLSRSWRGKQNRTGGEGESDKSANTGVERTDTNLRNLVPSPFRMQFGRHQISPHV